VSECMDFGFLCNDPAPPNGRKVAIIGAGPSGLAAAGYLACLGYQVDVYDKLPRAGGLMAFGIPSHRIPQARVDEGIKRLKRKLGVNFHLRTKICCSVPLYEEEGDHFSADMRGLGDLVAGHDAVMICSGSWRSRKLNVPGEDLPGVYSSLQFLFPIRAVRYGAPNVSVPTVAGKRVAVVGAGHSAVDAAHSAVALGAAEVHVLYRRTSAEAPCGRFEIERMQDMGIRWHELVSPVAITGQGQVEAIELTQCHLGEPDATGRRCPLPDVSERLVLPVDVVIGAIGEIPTPPFSRELGLDNVRKGEVRWLHMTRIENVFVAGDALTGPSKIGKAVYSGLRAARSLTNWLDLKAQNRQAEYKYDDLIAKEARGFPGPPLHKEPGS